MFVDEIRLKCLRRKSCGIPLQYPSCENPMNSRKRQKDMTPEDKPQSQKVSSILLGKSRGWLLITPERMKQKWHLTVDVSGDGSKVQCCKEQYCTGTGNIRSMNQDKLDMVKQEMARVNINILRISKLKWTGMDEFNSEDHYIYYSGQESLRRNGVALIVNKKCSTWVQSQKWQNDLG